MSRNNKHLLVLSFTIFSLLLSGCSLLMPTRRSNSSSQEDSVSSRIDFTSSNYSTSSNGRTSSTFYSTSSSEQSSANSSKSSNSSTHSSSESSSSYSSDDYSSDGLIIENGVVTGYEGEIRNVIIPEQWNGTTVTEIGSHAFFNCGSLKSILLPDSIVSIGNGAFYGCRSLTSIDIKNGIETISLQAFALCSSLERIFIPKSVTKIESMVFESCSSLVAIDVDENNPNYLSVEGVLFDKNKEALLTCPSTKKGDYIVPNETKKIGDYSFEGCSSLNSITLPSGLTTIGNDAFKGCESLESIEIPSKVSYMGYSVFQECSSLTSINIPASVTSIGNLTFDCCSSLTSINVSGDNNDYSSDDGVLFNKNKTEILACPNGRRSSYSVPDGVTVIGEFAFYHCSRIPSITIPDSVITIKSMAFVECHSVTTFHIGSKVSSIADDALYLGMGRSLLSFDVDELNANYSSIDGVLFNKDKTTLIVNPGGRTGDYVVPTGVTKIENTAFYYCQYSSVKISDTVSTIGRYGFCSCGNLTEVFIPKSVTSIGENVFRDCRNLTLYCEANDKPSGWSSNWNPDNNPVVWGHNGDI